jgi:hypothetical protein
MKGGEKKSEKNFLNMKQLIYGETFGCYTEKKLVGTVGKNFLPSFVNVLLWKIFNLDHGKGNSFLLIARFTTAMAGLTQLGMLEVP